MEAIDIVKKDLEAKGWIVYKTLEGKLLARKGKREWEVEIAEPPRKEK